MSPSTPPWQPLVILGAGRSGTNMLRDVLASLPGYTTWPCDEINYIWRHGSRDWPNDALPVERASERYQRFLAKRFHAQWKRSHAAHIVEKTCANTLRVPYVDRALQGRARFLHIARDGRDVTASATKRWTASLDLDYILKKARYVPLRDMPYYGFRYLATRLHRLHSTENRLGSWGPRYPGMSEDLKQMSLGAVISKQWATCVSSTRNALAELPESRHLSLRYEAFTTQPVQELTRIGAFLGEDWSTEELEQATASVRASNMGDWEMKLEPELAAHISEEHADLLNWAESIPAA
ncbi:MAG: sulfotransferase [Planctomycetes bacterium]|nr:sulfotransferase [Planctomycetota bacterium]